VDETQAKLICEKNGAALIDYENGKVAYLILPSKEHVIISVGTQTVQVVTKRFMFGWRLPKVVVSKDITDWEPNYHKLGKLNRMFINYMILDGLLSLISRIRTLQKLSLAWIVLKNPIKEAFSEGFNVK